MINSQGKKSEFSVFKAINADKGVYEIKWGYEPVVERVTKLNEKTGEYEFTGETKETSFCTYAIERFYTKPSTYAIDKLFDKSTKYPSMSEMKIMAEGLGVEENQMVTWMKERLKKNILAYDSSSNVNGFTINGIKVWLDKSTRVGLLLRFQSEQAEGKTETTLWYNGMSFPLPIEQAIQMLYAIEGYASACYDHTQQMVAAVDAMTTVDELLAFVYVGTYPDMLAF